jgi:dTDP-4-amino-4,6-dideoxygalactose transaminase
MNLSVRRTAKFVLRNTVGRLPVSAGRFEGALAIDGGKPARDARLRPWRKQYNNTLGAWNGGVRSALRGIFLRGVEGLPGPLAHEFAANWAKMCGCRYGLLLPHGTDALRIALAAALEHDGLAHGGEVIMPNLSFIASAGAALDRRFGIVLVDVEPGTLLIDPQRVEEAIIPGKTRAIMPVHLFGQPADMTALKGIAQRHGIKVIEDAAQAHGAIWKTGPVGSLGDAAGFSFQSFKNLACGEGGALTTNDEKLFERAYGLHNVGRARVDPERWGHRTLGWNCRPTEYQAALLLHRLKKLESQQMRRWENFVCLRNLLKETKCVEPLALHPGVRRHGVHMFVMRYKKERCGGLAMNDFLHVAGAEGLPIYRGYECTMSNQPALARLISSRPEYVRTEKTPVADGAVNELVYFPQEVFLGPKRDMEEIAGGLLKVERHYAEGP